MRNVYSVKQVNGYIKNMFTQDFMLNRIYVKGEVSNCKYHTSGHIYFSLKDESGTIACIMFAGQRSGLTFRMQEGQQVIVLGSISTYERDGRYQLYAKEVILDGAGLLYEKYEKLKQELEEMGMFAPEYKRPIPKFAQRIGIVTAPTGAAIRDIMNISYRRNPYVQLILYPALVQGENAALSIVTGIQMLEQKNVDIIIVGRGGGSIEDLWAFNEEIVARAIFDCSIPVISAVGHETDFTIADYAADLRAPTPSAAAELAVFDHNSFAEKLSVYKKTYRHNIEKKIEQKKFLLSQYRIRMNYLHPEQKLREKKQLSADLQDRLRKIMSDRIKISRHQLAIRMERMKGLSPIQKLNQGFSYVATEEEKTLRSVEQIREDQDLKIYVTDGVIKASVKEIIKGENYGGADTRRDIERTR